MRISVCIPTYNGSKYIKEQLMSILPQISLNDEIIISDNGSEDDTVDIISSLNDNRIRIHVFTKKKSVISNIENALLKVTGDYIFLADQDDVWKPNKVDRMLSELRCEKHLIMSDAEVVDESLNVMLNSMEDWREYKTGFMRNLVKSRYLGCCMAFDRVFLEQILPFPKRILAHDVWIGLYGELSKDLTYVNEPLILYRRHSMNLSTASEKSRNSLFTMVSYRLYFLITTIYRLLHNKFYRQNGSLK